MELKFTPIQMKEASALLSKYYGIASAELPAQVDELELEEKVTTGLTAAYNILGSCPNDELLQCVFLLLTHVVNTNWVSAGMNLMKNKHKRLIYRDCLRLFILSRTTHLGDALVLKNKSRSYRLDNDENWLFLEIVNPYLEQNLGLSMTMDQAQKELDSEDSHHRGRRASDPRVPRLMFGTWRLLTDLHGFHTPMPNVLCGFIIRLLQLQGIFPENTDIDTLWVRAQLRYLNGKANKANQESCSGS